MILPMKPASSSAPGPACSSRCRRYLPAVVGATGTLLIIASTVFCYLRVFNIRSLDIAADSLKTTLLIAVTLFLTGAAALVGATRLHGD